MFRPLLLSPPIAKPAHHLAPIAAPLKRVAERGGDIAPVVLSIARSFGFDGFLYGASLSLQPVQASHQFIYSTWPADLFPVYDQRGYIEVDPRVKDLLESVTPLVWDQSTYAGRSPEVDAFMAWLRSYGICSGVTCPLRDVRGRLGAMFLSCNIHYFDEPRRLMIERNIGDIGQFGACFHEMFVNGALNALITGTDIKPHNFTPRERECLLLAAKGMTTEDIATMISVSLRTVQAYFDRVRKKMGVHNRAEAIARGLQIGII